MSKELSWRAFRKQYTDLHLCMLRSKVDAESRLDVIERILRPTRLADITTTEALHRLQLALLSGVESRRPAKGMAQVNKPRSPHTVRTYMAVLIAALRWAEYMGMIQAAPQLRRLKTSKLRHMKGRPLTAAELNLMLDATEGVVGEDAAASWKYMLRGLWASGLRLGELMHVHWCDDRYIVPAWPQGMLPVLQIPATMQKNETEESIPLLPEFERVLLETPVANRVCGTASMLFRFARKARLIPANPFEEVERGSIATTRRAFVGAATATLVIDAMKDSQWRLLVALGRWAGLRVPSEPRLLRWGDIDWERNRFTVHSPKTRHHGEGHATRVLPIFPELRRYFDERWDDAEQSGDHGEFVLPMMKGLDDVAFGCQVRRTIIKLGLEVWPRTFHSMRSTRQTELAERFPSHVVCGWLGNSESVARKHYLQTTDAHFQQALQKPLQQVPETTANESKAPGAAK